MVEATQTSAPNGAAPPKHDPGTDDDILSGLAKLRAEGGDEAPSKPPAPAEDGDESEAEPEEKPADEPEKPDEDADDEAERVPDAAAESEPSEPDPKLAKNLEAITRAEKRSLEKVAAEQKKVSDLQAHLEKEWAPKVEAAQAFEQYKARAKYDPAGVLEALGIDLHADGELIARQVYSRSKAAAANPQTREAAERALREREQSSELAAVRKQMADLAAQLQQRDRQAEIQRDVERYVAGFEKAIDDDAPLAKAYLANDKDEAIDALASLAAELTEEHDGERPDAADVVKEFEKRRRAQLKKLGIAVPAPRKGATKTMSNPAGETRTAKTLTSDLGNTTKPQTAPLSPEEERDDILKGMRELRAEASE